MRKRMIDPHFWESAGDKGWSAEDCVVMMAAISAADDYGKGRIKTLKDSTNGILTAKKFIKSLENLKNSVKTYNKSSENFKFSEKIYNKSSENFKFSEKIYYFLPNWEKYQKVSHPNKSNIPDPKPLQNNELPLNFSGKIRETFAKPSAAVKVSLNKYSLNKFKVGEDQTTNTQPSNFDLPLPLLTEEKEFQPQDFDNKNQVTESVKLLLTTFCNIQEPKKEEISSFVNVVMNTKNVKNKTAFKYVFDTFNEFNSYPDEKKNLKYVYSRVRGRIDDALIVGREERAKADKQKEKEESELVVNNDIQQLNNKFQIN
jgi:hypothetical protein